LFKDGKIIFDDLSELIPLEDFQQEICNEIIPVTEVLSERELLEHQLATESIVQINDEELDFKQIEQKFAQLEIQQSGIGSSQQFNNNSEEFISSIQSREE
jgi:hypothetical protein